MFFTIIQHSFTLLFLLQEDIQRLSEQVIQLKRELEYTKSLRDDTEEEKVEEIRILCSILYELRMKYQELQTGPSNSNSSDAQNAAMLNNKTTVKKFGLKN